MAFVTAALRLASGCLVLLMLAAAPGAAFGADNAVGWVQEAKGEAFIVSAGVSRKAAVEMGFQSADTLKTGANGRIQVMFRDKTTMALAENSEVLVKNVIADASKSQRFLVSVLKGTVGLLAGAIAKKNPEQFGVETPLAYLGVRGTEFASAVDSSLETHGLYEGGPIIVRASAPVSAAAADPAADAQQLQQLCKKLDEAAWRYSLAQHALESNRENSAAVEMADKAQAMRTMQRTYKCR